jgi:serine/threonine-protein kinase
MSAGATGSGVPDGLPKPGEVFAEKYRIERIIGVGGMAHVLLAKHVHLDEQVAIKILFPQEAQDPGTLQRFLREGRAAVKIRSEHVARVFDVAIAGNTPYLVMEYLEGLDLAALVTQRGRIPVQDAVDYLLQACEALAEAHAMKTIHRDLKPSNLFLVQGPDGADWIKVLDFGISKMDTPNNASLAMTRPGVSIGTPLYMSPEQLASSKDVDLRADIWGLGTILFELIAARPPFAAQSLPELGAMVLTGTAPDVRTFVPETPPGVAEAVAKCLRRDRAERFASCAELAVALAPFGSPAAAVSSRVISFIVENGGRRPPSRPPPSWTGPAAAPVAPPSAPTPTPAPTQSATPTPAPAVAQPAAPTAPSAVKATHGSTVFMAPRPQLRPPQAQAPGYPPPHLTTSSETGARWGTSTGATTSGLKTPGPAAPSAASILPWAIASVGVLAIVLAVVVGAATRARARLSRTPAAASRSGEVASAAIASSPSPVASAPTATPSASETSTAEPSAAGEDAGAASDTSAAASSSASAQPVAAATTAFLQAPPTAHRPTAASASAKPSDVFSKDRHE